VASSRLQSESRYAQALYMQWFFQQVVLQNAANSENVADPRVSKTSSGATLTQSALVHLAE